MKIRKKFMTLLEIMIVIFLIGIIGSVIGYNMKGSLTQGKIFKTKEAQNRIKDILMLEAAKGASLRSVAEKPAYYLKKSNLVKNENELLKDGWGVPFEVKIVKNEIEVISKNLAKYDQSYEDEKIEDQEY
mgnify:CR=1 FL=1